MTWIEIGARWERGRVARIEAGLALEPIPAAPIDSAPTPESIAITSPAAGTVRGTMPAD